VGTLSRFIALISLIFVTFASFYAFSITANPSFGWDYESSFCDQKNFAAANQFGSPFRLDRHVLSLLKPH
jgi:hypothetical protein